MWLTLLKSISSTDIFLGYLENYKYNEFLLCFDWVHSLHTCLTTEGTELQEKVKEKKADLQE